MRRLETPIEAYLKDLRARGYAPRTVEGCRTVFRRFLQFLGTRGTQRLEEVTPRDVADYQADLMLHGGVAGRALSSQCQAQHLGQIRQFFRYCLKQGWILVTPAEGLVLPKARTAPPRHVLGLQLMKRLLLLPDVTDLRGLRDRAMLETFYGTGVRVTELLSLDTADVDLGEGELTVRRGKGGKRRRVPMGDACVRWVTRYLEESRPKLLSKPNEPALFLSWRGRRMDRANLAKIVRNYGRKLKLGFVLTPHLLRHTFATHLLKGKASLRHVQEMLGHAKLSTTQIYTHVDLTDLKETHRRCHPRGKREGQ